MRLFCLFLHVPPLLCCGRWCQACLCMPFSFQHTWLCLENWKHSRSWGQSVSGHVIVPNLHRAPSSLLYKTCFFIFCSTSAFLSSCKLYLAELRVLVCVFSLIGLRIFNFLMLKCFSKITIHLTNVAFYA